MPRVNIKCSILRLRHIVNIVNIVNIAKFCDYYEIYYLIRLLLLDNNMAMTKTGYYSISKDYG